MPGPITGIGPSQALTELFGLTGKLPLQLEGFVVPVAVVGDLNEAVQWGPLAFGAVHQAGGGAANNNKVEISLPIGVQTQGIRAFVESLTVRVRLATYINIRPSPGVPLPTGVGVSSWADTRKRGLPHVLLNAKNDSVPTAVQGVIYHDLPANTTTTFDLGWILGQNPDTGVQQGILIEANVLNTDMTVNVRWREGAPR